MVIKKAFIVVGLGYGDEGKGLATDFLCLHNPESIVVKYNGGHQSGHCVITKDGKKHVFSHFGSGSFRNIPTYRSKYCTFEPQSFLAELQTLGFKPTIYVDEQSLLTSYYDVFFNQAIEISRSKDRIGSTGAGYRTTMERQEQLKVKLLFKDIFTSRVLDEKLDRIKEYYRTRTNLETSFVFDSFPHELEIEKYHQAVEEIRNLIFDGIIIPIKEKEIFLSDKWKTFIFEGSQGILLDQNFGTKPHITLSNTTSKNAHDILNKYNEIKFSRSIYYVTRAYQTRHGIGPFRERSSNFILYNNENESNQTNEFQGEFRSNFLDIDQLNYALKCDEIYSKGIEKNLLITCLDHFHTDMIKVFKNNKEIELDYKNIHKKLSCNFNTVKYSFSGCAELI